MFGLPIVLAALALNGAPTSLPVGCNPDTTVARGSAGLTWFVPGTTSPLRIEFAPDICAGLVWLSASPVERTKILALNPSWSLGRFEAVAGVALVVVLHEAHHASGDRDEAHTEACAMTHLDAFAAQWAPASDLAVIVAFARVYDAGLPADYHGTVC